MVSNGIVSDGKEELCEKVDCKIWDGISLGHQTGKSSLWNSHTEAN